jgi:hypothetical protein
MNDDKFMAYCGCLIKLMLKLINILFITLYLNLNLIKIYPINQYANTFYFICKIKDLFTCI